MSKRDINFVDVENVIIHNKSFFFLGIFLKHIKINMTLYFTMFLVYMFERNNKNKITRTTSRHTGSFLVTKERHNLFDIYPRTCIRGIRRWLDIGRHKGKFDLLKNVKICFFIFQRTSLCKMN